MAAICVGASAGRSKSERIEKAAQNYIQTATLLSEKISNDKQNLPCNSERELGLLLNLESFLDLLNKHIDLIVDYKIMDRQTDNQVVIPIADKILNHHNVGSWSFDKGFYSKTNKELLQLEIPQVVMPKKGRLNQQEKQEENDNSFKKYRYLHSAVKSNMNELQNHGLERCPDRGFRNYSRYIALDVCAYNLKKIGNTLIQQDKQKLKQKQKIKIAA
ncbi:MAG: hypothetical protein ACLFQS_10490 [Bacteroidales bacterium]